MDNTIASDAPVGVFTIGPSTALGRALALRVLLCGSAARVRRRLAAALRAALPLAAAWLHPRDNTRGILLAVCAVALLLRGRRGRAGLRARVQSAYRRKFWRNMMRAALTYEEWAHAARMLERETAHRRASDADLYDEELVRNKLRELRHRRQEGSLRDIVFCMRADLLRNRDASGAGLPATPLGRPAPRSRFAPATRPALWKRVEAGRPAGPGGAAKPRMTYN